MQKKIIPLALLVISLMLIPTIERAFATEVAIYNITNTGTALALGPDSLAIMAGEEIESTSALKGDWFNKMTVRMSKTGNPTGTLIVGIYDSTSVPTNGNYIKLLGSKDVSSLATSPTAYNFTFTNTTISSNTVIGVFFDGGSVGNTVNVNYGGNAFNGTSTQEARYRPNDGGWVNDGFDMSFTLVQVSSSSSGIVNGLDCNLPENEDKLVCRLNDIDQTPFSGSSQLIGTSISDLMIQTGLIDGTDTNPQTNGTGYIILLITMGVFVGIMWVASRGDLSSIPTFIWFIITLAVVGAITAFGYIDPTFLIISVIAIVGLAVAKAKGVFSGTGLFAGEQR